MFNLGIKALKENLRQKATYAVLGGVFWCYGQYSTNKIMSENIRMKTRN